MRAKVGVLGGGSLGLATAVGWTGRNHEVVLVEPSLVRFREISRETFILSEQELLEAYRRAIQNHQLEISMEISNLQVVRYLFICIENLASIWAAVKELEPFVSEETCLVIKSTVPVGTADAIEDWFKEKGKGIEVISFPDFSRKGKYLQDILQPTRVVLGGQATQLGMKNLRHLLARDSLPIMVTTRKNAEMIKLASNSFLAAKISYINQIAQLCDALGADIQTVSRGMGLDPRIGQAFLGAGIGFGGPGLPKDLHILIDQAHQYGMTSPLLETVLRINDQQSKWMLDKLKEKLGELEGKTLAVWGVAFKGGTDEIEQSVALNLMISLLKLKANLQIYDPQGLPGLRGKWETEGILQAYGGQIQMEHSPLTTLEKAHALLILTDCNEFKEIHLTEVKGRMEYPLVLDGRNLFPPLMMKEAGFEYISVGRKV